MDTDRTVQDVATRCQMNMVVIAYHMSKGADPFLCGDFLLLLLNYNFNGAWLKGV